ncbi:hypothetical protein ACLB2K_041659 [Fragaria x ananassa]
MVPSPQVPTRESRRDGGDVPETYWQEEKFNAALASQSALGWGLSRDGHPRLIGECAYVARQSSLDWGLSRSGQSVRAWLGTVARWPVSPRLIGDCREVASQSTLGWGLSRGGQSVRA